MEWLVCGGLQLNGKWMAMPENPVSRDGEGRRETGERQRGRGKDDKKKGEREREKKGGEEGKERGLPNLMSPCLPLW